MNQSVFLVTEDFFDNPFQNIESVSEEIESNCSSEKLSLVYDPIVSPFFEELAKADRDLFELVLIEFFGRFDKSFKRNLPWYCLDDYSSYHINTLGELLLNLNYTYRGVYSFGLIPINADFRYFVYFFISPYDIADRYYIIPNSFYSKVLKDVIQDFDIEEKIKQLKK